MFQVRDKSNLSGEVTFQQSATHSLSQIYQAAIWPCLVASVTCKNRHNVDGGKISDLIRVLECYMFIIAYLANKGRHMRFVLLPKEGKSQKRSYTV